MEFIFELLFELIFEGTFEVSKNKKVNKWIRYPAIALILLLFILVIFLFFIISFITFNKNRAVSVFFGLLGVILSVSSIIKFRNVYIKNIGDKNDEK